MAPRLRLLGRRAGLIQGAPAGRAQGNAPVRVAQGALPGRPGATAGGGPEASRPLTTAQQRSSSYAYAGRAFRHSRLVVRDRHVVERRGRTTTSARDPTPRSGIPNPQADGPARPAGEMVNRTISWQQGVTHTRGLDNTAPHAKLSLRTGRAFPLSTQGSATDEPVYGGTPHLLHPYGARGRGLKGPSPRVVSLPGGPVRPGITLTPGATGDGPQTVSGGEPHGLHSQTLPDQKQHQARLRSITTMRPGYMTRPASSKIAGQSMSQFVVPLSGRGGGPPPVQRGGRVPGVTARFVRRNTP